MDTYLRSSVVRAVKMTRAEYVAQRGWLLQEEEDGLGIGYLVSDMNHRITWMPFKDFEMVHRMLPSLNFGDALQALKDGKKITRKGWNGKGQFVYMVPAAKYAAQTGAAKSHFGEEAFVPYNAYLAIKGVDDTVSTWVPSVTDVLAEDWSIVI